MQVCAWWLCTCCCHRCVPVLGICQWQNLAICIQFYQMGNKKCGFCSQTHFMPFWKSDTKHFSLFSAESVSSSLPSYFDVRFLTLTMFLFHSVLHLLSFVLHKMQVLNYSKLFSSFLLPNIPTKIACVWGILCCSSGPCACKTLI